jgi:hypothetical protein
MGAFGMGSPYPAEAGDAGQAARARRRRGSWDLLAAADLAVQDLPGPARRARRAGRSARRGVGALTHCPQAGAAPDRQPRRFGHPFRIRAAYQCVD